TVTNSCGTAATSRVVTINALPVAGTFSGDAALCAGSADTFIATITGGTWTAINSHATVSTTGIVVGVSAGVDTIVYTVSNSCGSVSTSRTITINPLPVAGTISGAAVLCVGDTAILTESVTGGTWAASNTHAHLTDSMAVAATVGLDTISYTVTNGCGTAHATHIINVSTVPVLGAISGPRSVCVAGSITLTATISGGIWTVSNGHASSFGGIMSGVSYGRDTVTYIFSNTCGADTATLAINVDTTAPRLSAISGPAMVCVGSTVTLSDSVTGGTWAVSGTHASISTLGAITGISAGVDTVTYQANNGCGSADTFRAITIAPLPNAGAITGYDSLCIGATILLSATGTTGGTWVSDNSDFVTVDGSGHVYGALNGSANILYIVTNACGSDTATHRIAVNIPVLPIIGSNQVCQFATTILLDPLPGGTWASSNILVAPCVGGVVLGITPGFTTISYTVDNACGATTAELEMEVIVCPATVSGITTTSQAMELFPNPTAGSFTLTVPSAIVEDAHVIITNVVGEKVAEMTIPANKATDINLSVPSGVYFISAGTTRGNYSARIVVEN
ncbi:MAG: T9SS C-terminal target domain-containing protein, partial [Chitinophagia bacterium]|nr:T9SS C-terminal target domain-containing protein [Chitinophagia bacterium]